MKILCGVLIAAFLFTNFACSSLPEVDSTPAQDLKPSMGEQQKSIIQVKKHIKSGKPDANISYLIAERQNYKGTEFEAEIEQLLAQEYSKSSQYSDAGLAYLRAARSSIGGDRRFKLCHEAGKSFYSGQDWERLKKGVDYCLNNFDIPPEHIRELKAQKLQGMEAEGVSPLEVARAYVDFSANSQGDSEVQSRTKALQILETMNRDMLSDVVSDTDFGFLRGHAAYRLAQIYLSQRDTESAKTAFAKVNKFLPETELAEISLKKIEQLEMANHVNASTIGAVLPLSGKHAALGQKVLRGLQIGLGLDGEGASPLRLAVVDSEGNPDLARKGVEKLVQEDNVVAVVGSLLSKTANAVADQSQVLNVPNLALSQKSGLTNIGENIFRYGMTSEMQVRYLVKRCIKDLGMRRFAIIYPNDKFGVEYANLFWDEVLARGGEVRAAQSYDSEETDFSGLVQRLAGTFYQEERQEEAKWALKIRTERQRTSPARARTSDDLLSSVMDFDAIFIADGVKALGQISAMLAFNGVKGIKLIGPNLWNNETIVKRVGNSGNQIMFVDGAKIDSKVAQTQGFFKLYKANYNEEPGAFEIQGYEIGLLLTKMLSDNIRTREEFRERLKSVGPVKGVAGSITLGEGREFSKPLYLYAIENNQIKILTQ
jgi:ABC-type branched-subunit amino acid transport system substrate-binding protein